jgi:hypothetical protein
VLGQALQFGPTLHNFRLQVRFDEPGPLGCGFGFWDAMARANRDVAQAHVATGREAISCRLFFSIRDYPYKVDRPGGK